MANAMMNPLKELWYNEDGGSIWEIEIVKREDYSLANFETIESVLTSLRNISSSVSEERLEIIIGSGDYHGWCIQIDGINNIRTYCEQGNPWIVPARWMLTLIRDSRSLPNTHCVTMKCSVLKELEENPANISQSWWQDAKKYHRLKKMYNHIHLDTGINYQVTLERQMTTETPDSFKDALETNHTTHRVRATWHSKNKREPSTTARTFYQHGMRLAAIARNEPVAMQLNEHEMALKTFGKLIAKARRTPRKGENVDERPFFLAPKPVTLERVHLIDPDERYGAVSIQNDYCVTDKADGERMLLYINEEGKCYLINNLLEVRGTGIVAKSKNISNTVVDGEYIDAAQMSNPGQKNMFVAFDVYFYSNQSVINRPLIPSSKLTRSKGPALKSRYEILKDMFEDFGNWNLGEANVALSVKTHLHAKKGRDIFDKARETLQAAKKLPYANDGLIFTPASLYVWGVYDNGRTVSITPDMSRWDRVFKWKPADMNSVDFLVRSTGETRIGNRESGGVLNGFELLCGYNTIKSQPILVDDGMRYLYNKDLRNEIIEASNSYKPVLFEPNTMHENASRLWLPDNKTLEGEKVTDDTIVECQFDVDNGEWRAMRVREDKTRVYRATKTISRAANDMSTALNIWMTIHTPVTKRMIEGYDTVTMSEIEAQEAGNEERYYARDIARYHLLSVNMQNFHNFVIKKQLFENPRPLPSSSVPGSRGRLLELACGQAGDMSRWASANYHTVVGIDKNANNITDPVNGAYARGIRSLKNENRNYQQSNTTPNMCFLIGDCGKSLKTGEAFQTGSDSEYWWKALTAKEQNIPEEAKVLKSSKFDVVSCQFAIHYFFESSDILDTFLNNVSDYLRDGGYFITSFMDGNKVNDMFRDKKSSVVTGNVKNCATVWAIEKGYDTFNSDTDDAYAKKIHVYLETTRKSITEYLVPFKILESRAASVGLELFEHMDFEQSFKKEWNKKQSEYKNILRNFHDNQAVQKEFSNLNRWAVFKKSRVQNPK